MIQRWTSQWAFNPEFLKDRMVFLSGPRQIGKTTVLREYLGTHHPPGKYFNWDTPSVRQGFAKDPLFFLKEIQTSVKSLRHYPVGFDELHKFHGWKNVLKGYHDEFSPYLRFLVSGSARLDFLRKSGDSLLGRYFLFRMYPLGVNEAIQKMHLPQIWNPLEPIPEFFSENSETIEAVSSLLKHGGFPESFLSQSEAFSTRWRQEHTSLLIREDLREISQIQQMANLEVLAFLLPSKVGSPLSVNSLRKNIQTSQPTLNQWLKALKLVYYCFSVPPWSVQVSQALRKEEKYYLWDWSSVEHPALRFENFIAVQLSAWVNYLNETGKGVFSLYYLKTRTGKEVDFLISEKRKPLLLIEAKQSETDLSPSFSFFEKHIRFPYGIQIIQKPGVLHQKKPGRWVVSADRIIPFILYVFYKTTPKKEIRTKRHD